MTEQVETQFDLTKAMHRIETPDLKFGEKFLLIHLSTYGDCLGKNIFPSVKTIKKYTGISERTIYSSIKNLEKLGYLKRISGGYVNGKNEPNHYELNLGMMGIVKPENVVEVDFKQQPQPEIQVYSMETVLSKLTPAQRQRMESINQLRKS